MPTKRAWSLPAPNWTIEMAVLSGGGRLRSWMFAALYDRATRAAERGMLGEHRADLLAAAHGVVVEIGAGTGANLPHYDGGRIQRLILTEPDPHMRERLARKLDDGAGQMDTEVTAGTAEGLDLPDAGADVVVSTLVLCSVGDIAASVAECARVLKPGGQLLFLEHVCSEKATVRRWQERLTPIQRRVAGGCHLNRDTLAAIGAAGLDMEQVQRWGIPGPAGQLMPMIEGAAEKTAS